METAKSASVNNANDDDVCDDDISGDGDDASEGCDDASASGDGAKESDDGLTNPAPASVEEQSGDSFRSMLRLHVSASWDSGAMVSPPSLDVGEN